VDALQAARFPFPGPQKRGTGGTLNLIMRGMRPWPPARIGEWATCQTTSFLE
jgi:hypothetical protein